MVHLGLIVPGEDACPLNVSTAKGERAQVFQAEGLSINFDDMFPHSAANNTDSDRTVLYLKLNAKTTGYRSGRGGGTAEAKPSYSDAKAIDQDLWLGGVGDAQHGNDQDAGARSHSLDPAPSSNETTLRLGEDLMRVEALNMKAPFGWCIGSTSQLQGQAGR